MKKLFLLTALILSVNAVFAYNYNSIITDNAINENQVIEYSPSQNSWGVQYEDSLKFTKHYTSGSGCYSEYELNDEKYDTCSCYEFTNGDKLIGYNLYKLKFYYLTFNNDKFERQELTYDEIKSLFPNTEIVKISQFKNDTIVLYKRPFRKKTFLFINDTDREFYKYQFENYKQQTELIKGIFEPKLAGTYYYSHFGNRTKDIPPLKITIRYE